MKTIIGYELRIVRDDKLIIEAHFQGYQKAFKTAKQEAAKPEHARVEIIRTTQTETGAYKEFMRTVKGA